MRGLVPWGARIRATSSPRDRITPSSVANRVGLKGGGGVTGASQATEQRDLMIELPVVHG